MSEDQLTPQQRAEKRVHDRFERQRTARFNWLNAEREKLLHRQQAQRTDHDKRQALASEERREAFAAHDRRWEEERRRLANRTTRAPGFGLFGPPPRNLNAEYRERREAWERQRDAIRDSSDEKLEKLRRERIELAESHARGLLAHERWARLSQDDLARRQEKSFDAAVRRELAVGDRGAQRAFEKQVQRERER
ncbi:MAG: hypothetical protein IT557_17390 [Alphaproteobacteria bacterium]|nr:hypothetical protein [Alphaproteobacteria bacterium]